MKRAALVTAAGFVAGAVAGFIYAQETKRGIGDTVSTRLESDGRVIVEVDTLEALTIGFRGFLGG